MACDSDDDLQKLAGVHGYPKEACSGHPEAWAAHVELAGCRACKSRDPVVSMLKVSRRIEIRRQLGTFAGDT